MSLPSRERGLKYPPFALQRNSITVAPFTGAWIEIWYGLNMPLLAIVAPFTGAWIEITLEHYLDSVYMSLPSRERGLKYTISRYPVIGKQVAPFTGAWIEIVPSLGGSKPSTVAPFTGAWIEMSIIIIACSTIIVAPFTGAWIEIMTGLRQSERLGSLPSRERGLKYPRRHHPYGPGGRSLHGSVD